VVISPASTHDIKLVTEVVDKIVINRPKSLSKYKSRGRRRRRRRRRLQHLCLDKGYNSTEEEQKLIKRGYILHIPVKKKRRRKGEEKERKGKIMNLYQDHHQIERNTLPRDGLSSVLIRGIIDSENFSQGTKRRMITILDWYSSPVVS
jgi:hypothetical protein